MIREMRKSDWECIANIYKQSLESGNITFTSKMPTYEEWDEDHIKECRFVFEEDGRVVGYTMIAPTSKRDAYKGVVELSIFVDKSVLHKGIGTKLLTTLCEETEKKGYWTLYSAIFAVNTPSIELHKKCGFRIVGTREDIARNRFGEWRSTVIMERRNTIR